MFFLSGVSRWGHGFSVASVSSFRFPVSGWCWLVTSARRSGHFGVTLHGCGHPSFFPFSGAMASLFENHGSARFSGRKTWIRAFFGSKNMDPRVFLVEKNGSARFSDRKKWIRAFFWSKNMDPRVFLFEKHGSARFSGRKAWIRAFFGSKNMDPHVFRENLNENTKSKKKEKGIPFRPP